MSPYDDIEDIIAWQYGQDPLDLLPVPPSLVTSFNHVPAPQRALLLDAMLNSAMDGIVAHRPDGELVYYNTTVHEMLGYTSEEFAMLPAYGWVAPDAKEHGPMRIENILRDGWLTFDSAAVHKDGMRMPTEVRARRVGTKTGPVIVAVIRDVSERQAAQQQLLYMAFHDALTGLANRAMLDDHLHIAISDAKRYGDLLAAAYIDLDGFKPVNDQWGHATGDAALVTVARRLQNAVRAQDTVARLGGDEFLVLLPRVRTLSDLPEVARKLSRAIAEPIDTAAAQIQLSASIGVAVFEPDVDDPRSFIVKADVAMYEARRTGAPFALAFELPYEPGAPRRDEADDVQRR